MMPCYHCTFQAPASALRWLSAPVTDLEKSGLKNISFWFRFRFGTGLGLIKPRHWVDHGNTFWYLCAWKLFPTSQILLWVLAHPFIHLWMHKDAHKVVKIKPTTLNQLIAWYKKIFKNLINQTFQEISLIIKKEESYNSSLGGGEWGPLSVVPSLSSLPQQAPYCLEICMELWMKQLKHAVSSDYSG